MASSIWGKLAELRKLNTDAIREDDLQIGDLVEHTRELDLFNGKVMGIQIRGIIKNTNSDGLISFSNTSHPTAWAKNVKKAGKKLGANTSIKVKTRLKRTTD